MCHSDLPEHRLKDANFLDRRPRPRACEGGGRQRETDILLRDITGGVDLGRGQEP